MKDEGLGEYVAMTLCFKLCISSDFKNLSGVNRLLPHGSVIFLGRGCRKTKGSCVLYSVIIPATKSLYPAGVYRVVKQVNSLGLCRIHRMFSSRLACSTMYAGSRKLKRLTVAHIRAALAISISLTVAVQEKLCLLQAQLVFLVIVQRSVHSFHLCTDFNLITRLCRGGSTSSYR